MSIVLANYRVSFKHGTSTSSTGRKAETMTCFIVNKNDALVGKATVTQYVHDHPNAVKARKCALTKAIKSLSRAERTNVWEDYFRGEHGMRISLD